MAESKLKRNKDGYGYKYTDLAEIHNYLESNNMKYIQKVERIGDDDYIMTKRCFNDKWEEEWLQGCRIVQAVLIGKNNPAQEQGSSLTYARRYSLLMAFGLATEDDDAESLTKKTISKPPKQTGWVDFNAPIEDEKVEAFKQWIATNGFNEKEVDKVLEKYGYISASEIKYKDLKNIINDIQKLL